MNNYVERQVPSGQTVFIRARTYSEWEEQEMARLETLESLPELVAAGNVQKLELTLQRANITVRNTRLESWVKDFAEVKVALTLRDVAEIENAALELEAVEIPLGNSNVGGDGQLTPSGMPTATSAGKGTTKGKK